MKNTVQNTLLGVCLMACSGLALAASHEITHAGDTPSGVGAQDPAVLAGGGKRRQPGAGTACCL